MKADKRKQLIQAGWSVGSGDEFLGLTSAESTLVDIKLALATELRTIRARLRLSQEALAKRLHSSQSRIAKMEAADPSVSLDLLVRALFAAGITTHRLGHVIATV